MFHLFFETTTLIVLHNFTFIFAFINLSSVIYKYFRRGPGAEGRPAWALEEDRREKIERRGEAFDNKRLKKKTK